MILAAHIHSADHRLLTLVAEFDRRRGWELGGRRSWARWKTEWDIPNSVCFNALEALA